MREWKIEYWSDGGGPNSIEKWFDSLTREQFKSVAKEMALLEIAGNNLRLPHSKSLKNGIFELRERRYGYRIYYGFHGKITIILLAAGNKKSQKKDIAIARKRLLELGDK